MAKNNNGEYLPAIKLSTIQLVASVTASTASAAAFAAGTKVVRVVSTNACNIEFGSAPTAVVATSTYLPANAIEYFEVSSGDKIAVIKFTGETDGSLYVTEMEI